MSSVFQVIEAGNREELQTLLANEPELASARNEQGVSALLYTLYQRKPELTECLLSCDPKLDVLDAAALGRVERLVELLDADAGLIHHKGGDGFSPLHLASFFADTDTARFLLDRGADVAVDTGPPMGLRPLHSAAAVANLETCQLLLERGGNPNEAQQGGWTALHSAAMHGNLELTKLLLAHGASATQAADVGKNALDFAREGGHSEVEALLTNE